MVLSLKKKKKKKTKVKVKCIYTVAVFCDLKKLLTSNILSDNASYGECPAVCSLPNVACKKKKSSKSLNGPF